MKLALLVLFMLFPGISCAESKFFIGKWEAFQPVHTQFFSYLYLEIDENEHGKMAHSLTLGNNEPDFVHEIAPEDIAVADNVATIGPLSANEGIEYVLEFHNKGGKNGILSISLLGEKQGHYEYNLIRVDIYNLESKIRHLTELRNSIGVGE